VSEWRFRPCKPANDLSQKEEKVALGVGITEKPLVECACERQCEVCL